MSYQGYSSDKLSPEQIKIWRKLLCEMLQMPVYKDESIFSDEKVQEFRDFFQEQMTRKLDDIPESHQA